MQPLYVSRFGRLYQKRRGAFGPGDLRAGIKSACIRCASPGGLGYRARMLEAAIASISGFVELEIRMLIRNGSTADLLLTDLRIASV